MDQDTSPGVASNSVSVVIPAYNSAHFLVQAIESVLGQTRPAYEVIVVNDGSSDDTPQVLEPYAGRVIVLTQENQGLSVARNNGFARATGDWVAFLDADDVWEPDKLAEQLADVAEDEHLVCLHSNFRLFGEEDATPPPYAPFLEGRHDVSTLLSGQGWVCPSSAVVRRSVRARFYSWAPPAEDVIFFCELSYEGSFRYHREALVRHRIHPGQATKQGDAVMAGTMAELRWVREIDAPEPVRAEVERVFFASLVNLVVQAEREGRWRAYWRWRTWLRSQWPDALPRAQVLDERVSPAFVYRSALRVGRRAVTRARRIARRTR